MRSSIRSAPLTHTPHGLGVATMLPYVMTYNRQSPLGEMAEIADALGLDAAEPTHRSKGRRRDRRGRALFAAIGITPTLAELGLAEDRLDWTAEQAIGIERLIKNNPRPLDLAAMQRLVRAAYDGDLAAAR